MFYIKTKTHIGLGHGPASCGGNPVKLRYQAIICQHEMMSAEAEEETFFTMLQAERKWTTQGIDWFIKSFCVKDIFQRISMVKIWLNIKILLSPTCVVVVCLDCGGRAPAVLVVRLHNAVVTCTHWARVLHHPNHVLNIFLRNTLILNIARLNFVKLPDKNPQTEVWIWIDSQIF